MSTLPEPVAHLFVVGFPRSGTTLLRQILNVHPEVAIAPETHFVPRFWSRRHRSGDILTDEGWERLVRRLAAVSGLEAGPLLDRSKHVVRSWPGALRLVVHSFAAERGASVAGEKTPMHQIHMPLLQEWFPDARFVHLVRDPRAVVGSWRSVPWSFGSVGADAAEWRARHDQALRDAPRIRRLMQVRYEDLVRDTETVLRGICGFVGVDFDEAMLRHADPRGEGTDVDPVREPWKARAEEAVTPERIAAWRGELTPTEVLTVETVAGTLSKRLGYEASRPLALRLLAAPVLVAGARISRRVRALSRHLRPAPGPPEPPRSVVSDACGEAANPYGRLLSAAVEAADPGWALEPFRPRDLFRADPPALWHMHWPEGAAAQRSTAGAVRDALGLCAAIAGARLRRVPLVWTTHNAGPHEGRRERISGWVMRAFVRRLDGWVSLSEAGAAVMEARYPELAERPRVVVPHGHYRGWYGEPPGRAEARGALGLREGVRLLLFLGHVRPYKRIPELIDAFAGAGSPGLRLLIAGRPDHPSECDEVEQAARDRARVTLRLGHVPDAEVPVLLAAADGFVLPAERLLNSGSALLALSYGLPVLVPDSPVMRELRSTVGREAVHLHRPGSLRDDLERFVGGLDVDREEIASRVLSAHDWGSIGEATADLYRAVALGGPGSDEPRRSRPGRAGRAARPSPLRRLAGRFILEAGRATTWLPEALREPLRRAVLAGRARDCPLCRRSSRRFLPAGRAGARPEAMCPWCGSLERHRGAWLYFERATALLRDGGRFLHLAPERGMTTALERAPGVAAVASDLEPDGVDVAADLTALPFPDATFDWVYCSHVLEHVPEDRAAMAELWRVLRPGGTVVVQVPVRGPTTYEDPSITRPEDRLIAFGQEDHVRWYGLDVVSRLEKAGFEVTPLRTGDLFSPDEIRRRGLVADELLFRCDRHG